MAAGKKTGGRQAGSKNKATKAREEVISASGLTPLEYMLSVLRDPGSDSAQKMDAAKGAAPYVHPKLSAMTLKGDLNVKRIERVIVDPSDSNAKGVRATAE